VPEAALERLHENLWVATRPLRLWVGDVGTRMSVVRLAGGGLLLYSPVPLDARTRAALDALGPVRFVMGPSRLHHFYLGEYAAAYPEAKLLGAPGLPQKRRDLHFHHVAGPGFEAPWKNELELHLFAGAPQLSEVVCFHRPSRSLLVCDLVFNVRSGPGNRARLFHRLVGATDRFGPHRIARAFIRDRAAARRSLETILAWEFDRVVVTHGQVLEAGGREAMRRAFTWLAAG
jgi:hypothetical protein